MVRQTSSDTPQIVALRATAWAVEHLLPQLQLLGEDWPDYMPDIINCRVFFNKIIDDARKYGYVGVGR